MSNPMKSQPLLFARYLILFTAWAGSVFGALQIHKFDHLFGHSVCGPWGCGPPVSALIGYHSFWLLLVLPAAAIFKARYCPTTVRVLGTSLLVLSVAGMSALLLFEGLDNSAAEQYPLQWCGFRLVTFVDFPLMQVGIAGLWLRWTTRSSRSCHVDDTIEALHV